MFASSVSSLQRTVSKQLTLSSSIASFSFVVRLFRLNGGGDWLRALFVLLLDMALVCVVTVFWQSERLVEILVDFKLL